VISVAAGLVVSRVGDDDIGNQIAGQLFSIPRALGLTGKKKNALQDYLAKITEWRNAFAHGKYSTTPRAVALSATTLAIRKHCD